MTEKKTAARAARMDMGDDIVVPFTVDKLDVRGRVVRLGPAVDAAIRQHAYPEPVSRLLGEVMALAVLLGAALKFDGKLIVQVQTSGPVNTLVADFTTPEYVRGLARFDAEALARLSGEELRDAKALLGEGHMAFTIDQGPDTERYQGVVEFAGSLSEATRKYFGQSEQLLTHVHLAAGQARGDKGAQWRAGAFMIQHLPPASGGGASEKALDNWPHALALAETVEDHGLLDPEVSPERLLLRLFHEDGVRVFDPRPVSWRCDCSREGLLEVLRKFSAEERAGMVENGKIVAKCQFCSREHVFTPGELEPPAASGET